MTIPKPD